MQKSTGKGETMKLLTNFDRKCGEDVCKLPELVCLKILRCYGETCEGQVHGEGVASFEDGHMYKGMFSKGLMNGFGVLILENGLKYEGEFVCNTPSGRGTYTWLDGSTYTGEIYQGKRHGRGSYKSAKHGASYIGQWFQGRRHGEGTVFYNEDKTSWYKGDWVMNIREGSGVRCYPSGNIYSGGWKNNLRHGEGTASWLELGQRYDGEWENGVQHGFGRHIWILERAEISQYFYSNQYQGGFFEGQRHGEGTFYYAGGAIYKGGWKNNKKHGHGKFTGTDGRVFEGEFVDDRLVTPSLNGTGTSDVAHVLQSDSSLLGPDTRLSIDHLLEKLPERKRDAERKQVESVVRRMKTELRSVYSFYSRLGRSPSPDNAFMLTCLQLWRLLKDCSVHRHGLTLMQVDCLTGDETSLAEIHSPFTPVPLREFLSKLVILAFYIYKKDLMSEKHLLASCFTKLLTEDLFPNATKVKDFLFRQPDFTPEALKYMKRCWDLFEVSCRVDASHQGKKTMTWRQLMWMFEDLHLFDHQLTTATLLEVITAGNHHVINPSSFLEQEIIFLEFFETLLACAEVKCQQVCGAPEDQDLLRSEDGVRDNLLREADEKHQTGRVTAQDVGSHEIPQVADPVKLQSEGKDEQQNRTEVQTLQVELLILTTRQFFDKSFLPAFDHHQLVTREMRKMLNTCT